MELDAKHQVLYALYAEYQQDVPDMASVTYKALEMDLAAYQMALIKLQNEGFINGLIVHPPDTVVPSKIKVMRVHNVLPTRYGVEYVEEKLQVDKSLTGKEKLLALRERFGKLGWAVLQAVVIEGIKIII